MEIITVGLYTIFTLLLIKGFNVLSNSIKSLAVEVNNIKNLLHSASKTRQIIKGNTEKLISRSNRLIKKVK